jgi:lactate permease
MGSLVLGALMYKAEAPGASPAYIIGANLSDFMAKGFIAISALLGALGSFFSGSVTVSNLTFGVVQQVRPVPGMPPRFVVLPAVH